jgi:hypothetical protein
MGRIRTAGLIKRGDIWHIDKTIGGKRLCESTGEIELEQAELYLASRRTIRTREPTQAKHLSRRAALEAA